MVSWSGGSRSFHPPVLLRLKLGAGSERRKASRIEKLVGGLTSPRLEGNGEHTNGNPEFSITQGRVRVIGDCNGHHMAIRQGPPPRQEDPTNGAIRNLAAIQPSSDFQQTYFGGASRSHLCNSHHNPANIFGAWRTSHPLTPNPDATGNVDPCRAVRPIPLLFRPRLTQET